MNFFQQSSLWEALHMSPHLYEKFDDAGFEDFIANVLGFPQHLAEYSYCEIPSSSSHQGHRGECRSIRDGAREGDLGETQSCQEPDWSA